MAPAAVAAAKGPAAPMLCRDFDAALVGIPQGEEHSEQGKQRCDGSVLGGWAARALAAGVGGWAGAGPGQSFRVGRG
jgi:hypothetical protein